MDIGDLKNKVLIYQNVLILIIVFKKITTIMIKIMF